jgi:hypothetical protein
MSEILFKIKNKGIRSVVVIDIADILGKYFCGLSSLVKNGRKRKLIVGKFEFEQKITKNGFHCMFLNFTMFNKYTSR